MKSTGPLSSPRVLEIQIFHQSLINVHFNINTVLSVQTCPDRKPKAWSAGRTQILDNSGDRKSKDDNVTSGVGARALVVVPGPVPVKAMR